MITNEYKAFIVSFDEEGEIQISNRHTGRKIKPYVGTDGYIHVSRQENGVIIRERLHRIIATCLVENPKGQRYVNHIDSNKTNNHPSNLEWCSNSENVKHGWESGNRIHRDKTSVVVYNLNKELIGSWDSLRQMAVELKVDRHRVARILKQETKNNYPYIFEYRERQSTIESVA